MGREAALKERGKNLVEYSTQKLLSLLICSYQFASLVIIGNMLALAFLFLANITLEALLVLFSYLCQTWLQ